MAELPNELKPISHYIKIANEHKSRDPSVYYWCLFYAVQTGLKIDKTGDEPKKYLLSLLDLLETVKKTLKDVESVSQDMVAQAHIEDYTLKLFMYADNQDRAGNFNKNVVKSFYTSGYLFDVLTLFGELDEKFVEHRKYAKWKAAYIHNCLKNGETPIAGPPGGDGDAEEQQPAADNVPAPLNNFGPAITLNDPAPSQQPDPRGAVPQQPVAYIPENDNVAVVSGGGGAGGSGPQLSTEHYTKATKLCKYAISAMQYEDAPAAIDNLVKAMRILQTGKLE